MKVVATRRYPGPAFDELDDLEVLPMAALDRPRPDVEGLIVANEPVPLELLPNLRIIANFGVGYDRIDVASCTERGVVVTNTPGVLDSATADLAFALILATRRQVVEGDLLVRSDGWSGSWSEGRLAEEVTGSRLGILGLGRIGQAVARRAPTEPASSTRRGARSSTSPHWSPSSSRAGSGPGSTSLPTSLAYRASSWAFRTSS